MSSDTQSRGVVTHSKRVAVAAMSLALLLSGLVVATSPAAPALALSFTVNDAGDAGDVAIGNGVCATISATCTLRAAIEEGNASIGADTVSFGIAGTAPIVITPASPLPAITTQINFNGYTQSGAVVNNAGTGTNAVYGIELVGAATPGVAGVAFVGGSAGSSLAGFYVHGFDTGIQVQAGAASNIVLTGNAVSNSNIGISINATTGTRVGGGLVSERNHIFSNGNGIDVVGQSSFTGIRGNLIGTTRNGLAAAGNNFGVHVTDGSSVTAIGGSTPADRNIISGNNFSGILVQALPSDPGDVTSTNILGNYIGTGATGLTAVPNGRYGIEVQGVTRFVSNTNIGDGTVNGRNVISGNAEDGISIWDSAAIGGQIRGNYIGVGADGFTPLGNDLAVGTDLATVPGGGIAVRNSASGFTVGGNAAGDGNVIANNLRGVVFYSGTGNRVLGNSISGNVGLGIELGGVGANDFRDNDGGANNGQNYPTLTAWQDASVLQIDYSMDSSVTSSAYPITVDFFLADSFGSGITFLGRAFANSPDEITPVHLGIQSGVHVGDPIVAVATDVNGNSSMFSPASPVLDPFVVDSLNDGGDSNIGDGVCFAVDGCTLRAAIEEANATAGMNVVRFQSTGTIVPTFSLPAITDPIVIDGFKGNSSRNTSATVFDATLDITLNGGLAAGVGLDFVAGSDGSSVRALTLTGWDMGIAVEAGVGGVGVSGNQIVGNIRGVMLLGANSTLVGGTDVANRNVISGNSSAGVEISGSLGNRVQGNLIGTTANGGSALPNGTGVRVTQTSSSNTIGGIIPQARNVISGNSTYGVDIIANLADAGSVNNNTVFGNYIGVKPDGNSALGNGTAGVRQMGTGPVNQASFNYIGDGTPGSGNVISGNGLNGIELRDYTNGAIAMGNKIGVGADGTTSLPNGFNQPSSAGVFISGTNNLIGFTNPGYPNIINGSAYGVWVQSGAVQATGNNISGNTISGAFTGIQLDNAPANDPGDADVGANRLQNSPTLTATVTAGSVNATVTLDSLSGNTAYPATVQFFEADDGTTLGTRYLSSAGINDAGTINAFVGPAAAIQIAPGDRIVATVTDANGNTSPFSAEATVGPIAGTATFINFTPGADFDTASNWDTNQTPGPSTTAVIPVGADVTIDQEVIVNRLVVQGTLRTADFGPFITVEVTGLATPSIITDTGQLILQNHGLLNLFGNLTVNGLLQSDAGSRVTTFDNDVFIGGVGTWSLAGELQNASATTILEIDGPLAVNTLPGSQVFAALGAEIDVLTINWTDGGATYKADAGGYLYFDNDLALDPAAVVDIGISGPSTTRANYGTLDVLGTLTRAGQLKTHTDTYVPTATDDYLSVYCGWCYGGEWATLDTQPLEPITTEFQIKLQTVPNKVISESPGLQGLGASVDVDGDWAIVGQTNGLSDTPLNRAAIYHYNSSTGVWDLIQTIQSPLPGYRFGEDVAIDGDWIAITARAPAATGDTTMVYNRSGAGPFTNFVGNRPGAGSVAIDHGMMVIGDPQGGTTGGIKNAMVYRLDSFGINTEQVLWPHGNGPVQFVDSYGSDVAIWFDPGTDEGTIAVSAPEPGGTAGQVYIFTRGTNLWNADPVEILSESDGGVAGPDSADQYGWSVAVTPDFLAVGARLWDNPVQDEGAAFVYGGVPGVYGNNGQMVQGDVPGTADIFGSSIALQGNILTVGAAGQEQTNVPYRAGAVYEFENVNDFWTQTSVLRAPDGQAWDAYGSAVAVSGTTTLVGAPGDANDNGIDAGAFYSYGTTAAVPPSLTFDMQVATGSPTTVEVAPSGLAVTLFDRSVLAAKTTTSVAASSISAIGVEDTALAAITIGSTPLRAIVLGSTPLRAIPLSAIDLTLDSGGGWPSLLLGTDLENKVISNLTFGDALSDPVVEGRIAALPLRAINVDGTPLSAIPLSAIALGSTPLRAIPLRAIGPNEPNPWCAIIADLLVQSNETCDQALDHLNLMEVTLRGVPLSAIPLRAIPLRAIDLEQSPLRAIPLSAIDLEQSPLRAIPLRAIAAAQTPLSAINVDGTPLRAIPLSAIPLRAIPLRAIPLSAIQVNGVPLSAIPLSAITVDGTPLRAITVEGLSVDGTPLRAIPLRAIPLRAIDLGASPLRAIPLRAIPLRAIPLRAIELYASPLRAIPLRAINVQGSPLSAIPLRAIPLSAIPLRAIPLSAINIGTTPLRAIPLRAIDVLSSPLRAIPLRAITALGVAVDCGLVDCELGQLGDAYRAGAISGDVTLEQILAATDGISLGELAPYFLDFGAAQLSAALADPALDMGDLTSVDGITLGDLPADLSALANLTLGDLGGALSSVTFGDLIGAGINPATGLPFTLEDLRADIDLSSNTVGDLADPGALTVGDLLDASTAPVYLQDLGSLLGYIPLDVLQSLVGPSLLTQLTTLGVTLGDLTPEQFGKMTLVDIVGALGNTTLGNLLTELGNAGLLDGFTLGDLLLAMLDPSSLAQSSVQFERVNTAQLPAGAVGQTRFTASFTLGGDSDRNVSVEIAVPGTASYVPGTATVAGSPIEPTVNGNTLIWNVTASPGIATDITFAVLPTLRLGVTSLAGSAAVVGTDIIVPATATVNVAEGTEPNDFQLGTGGVRQTTAAAEDTVYLNYISSPSDIDVYEINLAENDRLVAQLSNLDADLDVYLWQRADSATTGTSSLARASDAPARYSVTDPDAAAGTAEPLADFPRLDALDPSLQLVATSNATGTANESINTDRLPAGTYFIEVVGANGVTTAEPAALQLKVLEADQRPACDANGALPARVSIPAIPTIPASANTLVLVNPTRLQQLYGAAGRATVQTSIDALTSYLAGDGAALNVVPVVVPVDAYPAVRDAYDRWDTAAGACDPEVANAIVAAINSTIIDPHRAQFDHIVVLGGDQVIPMARLADNTGVANEYEYRHEFDGDLANGARRNAANASFWDSKILSDEPYGEASAQSLGDRFLYVSDAALGRVVETPAEIAAALDTFRQFNGTLSIDTAAVLGYDFLADGSSNVANALSAGGVASVDRELADGFDAAGRAWNRLDAETKINALTGNALVSLNAHFDHYRALPAVGDKVQGFTDNLIAADVAPAASLVQSLVFSMGCHSGFSASDILIGATNADWAQELGQDGSLFIGNTGFGYGDTKTVAYTEHLMELFAQQVTTPLDLPSDAGAASSTVGQALTWAKNAYMSQLQTLSVYDEKALQESTFYGLPFYRVGLPTDPLPVAPTRRTAPDATGTPSIRTAVDSSNQLRSTDQGLYFANTDSGVDQTIVAPGRPVQPKAVRDISVVSSADPTTLDQQAVGAIVLGLTSTYQSVPNPFVATPEFDQTRPAADTADASTFPSKPLTIATTTGPSGERQQLVIATGQYQSDTLTQRLDDNIDVVVYYADATNTDHTLPTVGNVDSTVVNGRLAISLTATDDTLVDRVYVLIAQNPGSAGSTWTGVDLVRVAGTDRWSGSLALAPGTTNVEFLVQAKDDAGNVGVASNKATNFADDLQPAPAAPVAPTSVLTAAAPTVPPSGSYAGPVTVQVNSTSPVTVTVDGVSTSKPTGPSTFVITGDGVHAWSVTSQTGHTTGGVVTIDGTAPTLTVDRAPGVVPMPTFIELSGNDAGSGVTSIRYSVTDPNVTTLAPPVAGQSVLIPLTVEGVNTITAEAFDAAGNSSGVKTFTYEVNGTPPVVTASLTTPPNAAGWINTPVIVTWNVDDPDANVPATTSVFAQGSNLKITSGQSCDLAGNCATGTVTLKVDYEAPTLELSTDRPGNTFDWNNTPVRVQSTCGLDVSGVSCPAPIVVTTDGAGQTVPVSVQDVAGNVTSKTSRVINIDQVPPTLTWNAPANGAIANTFTKPTCTASDALSGLNGTCAVDVDEPVLLTGYNQYTARATVADKAGNTSTLTSTWKVKMDLNPPVVVVTASPAANGAGWWKTSVTFSFVCTDVSPGVAVCPSPVTKTAEGGGQTFTVTASDLSGNDNIVTTVANIDKTAPTVTATAPTTVGPLDTVTITCAATDALSGINFAASNCTDRTFPASQLTAGPNVFTFSATDIAGNTTTVTKTVTLVVPVNPAPTVRADMGVAGLNDIGFQTNIVVLTGSYADPSGPGPYTASVRWTATGPFTPLILANDGSFVAAWIYGSAGTRTATVRICDAQGACGTDDVTVRTSVTQRITPVRECVTDRGASANPRYVARWGYNNPATFAIAVPSIPLLENTFTSSPYLRGQPQILLPGNQRGVFTTTFSSGTHTWKINGNSASALSTSPRC